MHIGGHKYSMTMKIIMSCEICSDKEPVWSLPHMNSGRMCNTFVVNLLTTCAVKSTGNQQAALCDIFATINMSSYCKHTKTWQAHLKSKLTSAANAAAQKA